MNRSIQVVIGLAVVLVVAGCATVDQTDQPGNSGVEGRTMVDGGCPTISPENPCPDVPLAAKIRVTRDSDKTLVSTAQSGDDGRYRITLAPGSYTMHAENLTGNLLPRGTTVHVRVHQGRFETVELKFDSGIRGGQAGG